MPVHCHRLREQNGLRAVLYGSRQQIDLSGRADDDPCRRQADRRPEVRIGHSISVDGHPRRMDARRNRNGYVFARPYLDVRWWSRTHLATARLRSAAAGSATSVIGNDRR